MMATNQESAGAPLLEIEDLHTDIVLRHSVVHAVDGVSLKVKAGETLGIVGESGCGKTMTGMSIMRLLPTGGAIVKGSIRLAGRDLVPLSENEMHNVRGNECAVIFQDPMTSLNPTMTIGKQVAEAILAHKKMTRADAMKRAEELLALVGMPRPKDRLRAYPHQLSGGLRQRVVIAIALAGEPRLLIADEPTTALDVTIQAQILGLLDDLSERLGMAILLITHDLGVIAGRADRVAVMYAAKVVEEGPAEAIFHNPHHPYTKALLESIPRLDQVQEERLYSIPGIPPDLSSPPPGCRFAPRCQFATQVCRLTEPVLAGDSDHRFACHHPVGMAPAAMPSGAGTQPSVPGNPA